MTKEETDLLPSSPVIFYTPTEFSYDEPNATLTLYVYNSAGNRSLEELARGYLVEYVATFSNVSINSGDEYRTCLATVKDLELICKSGQVTIPLLPDLNL